MKLILLTFIPLFVAIDPVGNIPLFLGLTDGLTKDQKRKLAFQAVATALVIGLLFGLIGRQIFNLLGISSADFRIAGGLLLLLISIKEIFGGTVKHSPANEDDKLIGVVPLGIPLIAGPATLTTLLILEDLFPYPLIAVSYILNLGVALLLLLGAGAIVKRIGAQTARALAKLTAIFLAAIGIMMIRKGIEQIISLSL